MTTPAHPIPEPEHTPTFGLDRWIARRRKEMGEARWKQLNDEWDSIGETA